MTAYQITALMHSGLGVAALLSYWVAALASKGSKPHKLAGRIYVLVMIGLLVPAVPLSAGAYLHFSKSFGAFLFYLLVITATVLWQGWFAIRDKRDFARYAGPGLRRLAWLNIGSGAAVLGLGLALMNPIFLGFSLIGLLGGRGMLRLAQAGPAHPRWWMQEHLNAMVGGGIATHIAFLSIGLPRLLPALSGSTLQNLAWLGPLVVAGAARWWLHRRYLRGATATPLRTAPAAGSAPSAG